MKFDTIVSPTTGNPLWFDIGKVNSHHDKPLIEKRNLGEFIIRGTGSFVVIAGPFDTLELAKLAYELMFS